MKNLRGSLANTHTSSLISSFPAKVFYIVDQYEIAQCMINLNLPMPKRQGIPDSLYRIYSRYFYQLPDRGHSTG